MKAHLTFLLMATLSGPAPARQAAPADADLQATIAALDSAVRLVLARRVTRRVDAERALLRATVGGFDALIAAHQAFEREAPLTPAAVAAQLAVMQGYVEQLRPPASSPPTGGKTP